MRPFNVRLWCCIGLLAGLATIIGCGSGGDLLDEPGQRYSANMEIEDVGGGTGVSIDIAQDDCDGNVSTVDPEDFGPVTANIEVSVAANGAGITLESYTIEYTALPSADSTGAIVTPVSIANPLPGYYNIDIPSGGSASFTITCMSVDTKTEYRDFQGWTLFNDGTHIFWVPPELEEGRFNIRITLKFKDTEGQTRTIPLDRTVWLGDFDNC